MAFTGYSGTLAGSTFGTVSDIQDLTWTGLVGNIISYKTLGDTNRYLNKCSGSRDPGELQVTCIFNATQYAAFKTAVDNDTDETWTLTTADGDTIVCDGRVITAGETKMEPDAVMLHTVTIALTGEPVITPA